MRSRSRRSCCSSSKRCVVARCEQELCPFWAGDGGCPCAVLDLREDDREEARRG
ncbi:hypothetical protein ACFPRL_30260 [Pseudoclavibacter helvolus]